MNKSGLRKKLQVNVALTAANLCNPKTLTTFMQEIHCFHTRHCSPLSKKKEGFLFFLFFFKQTVKVSQG